MWETDLESSQGLGNALRVGNEDDVRVRLAAVLCEPDSALRIAQANYLATQHVPWDNEYHGKDDRRVMQIVTNDKLQTVDIFNNDTQSLVRPADQQDQAFGKILNSYQLGKAEGLGNALRVGNEGDILNGQLPGVLADADAKYIIKDANFIATQSAPWDQHGPGGMGDETLRINPDLTLDLFNNNTQSVVRNNIAKLQA